HTSKSLQSQTFPRFPRAGPRGSPEAHPVTPRPGRSFSRYKRACCGVDSAVECSMVPPPAETQVFRRDLTETAFVPLRFPLPGEAMTEPSPQADKKSVEDLIELLDLERIEENLFRGHSPDVSWQRVFGGQVIGQALVAAYRTVEERVCH